MALICTWQCNDIYWAALAFPPNDVTGRSGLRRKEGAIHGWLIESVRVRNSDSAARHLSQCERIPAWRPPGLNSVNFMLLTELIDRKSLAVVVPWHQWASVRKYLSMGHRSASLLIKLGMIASPRAKSNQTFSVFAIASCHGQCISSNMQDYDLPTHRDPARITPSQLDRRTLSDSRTYKWQ